MLYIKASILAGDHEEPRHVVNQAMAHTYNFKNYTSVEPMDKLIVSVIRKDNDW
jgi:hypothetical protein